MGTTVNGLESGQVKSLVDGLTSQNTEAIKSLKEQNIQHSNDMKKIMTDFMAQMGSVKRNENDNETLRDSAKLNAPAKYAENDAIKSVNDIKGMMNAMMDLVKYMGAVQIKGLSEELPKTVFKI